MNKLETAIKKTQAYAAKYGQKLDINQLFLRLLGQDKFSKKEVETQFKKERRWGQKNEEWRKKLKKAKDLTEKHLSKIRGIMMVAVTGSVATETAKREEDIDLLIVTKAEELWWWRLYLRIYIWWHGVPHRRRWRAEKADEFCFNLWLDENHLRIPKEKQNLKNAVDLVMMKPIYEKGEIYNQFLHQNSWAKKYVATGYDYLSQKRKIKKVKYKSKKIWKIINGSLWLLQYLYIMRRPDKKGLIERGRAFFHEEEVG